MAKDLCIMCGKETAYDFETHIDYRVGYVEGAGQLCHDCHTGKPTIYLTSPSEAVICVSYETILNTPNDYELGEKVRQMYWNIKNS
jgi:hypothetical protein